MLLLITRTPGDRPKARTLGQQALEATCHGVTEAGIAAEIEDGRLYVAISNTYDTPIAVAMIRAAQKTYGVGLLTTIEDDRIIVEALKR